MHMRGGAGGKGVYFEIPVIIEEKSLASIVSLKK